MRALTRDQRKLLGEFCINFAIAWLSIGLIAPILSLQQFVLTPLVLALLFGGTFLFLGVRLV